ncbi:MAG: LPS-assembly protein LptD [Myxococcota bacterium]
MLVAGLLPALLSAVAAAQDFGIDFEVSREHPVTLTADQLEYESQREVYIARGNVVIVQGERTLSADWIAFNPDTGAGVASGNVELVEGTDVLRADFVDFNVETLEGVIREGRLDSPESRFRTWGSEIQKTGENTYTFKNGVFTTCRCPDEDATEPWRIRAKEAEVEVGGYGTVRDATIEVLGLPVAWLPWMIYPIKTERQTGFLFPELHVASRDGFGAGLPFFWAVHEQVNLTLTPQYTTKRGFKGSGELEYVFGEESEGTAVAAYGHDEEIDPHSKKEPYSADRWLTSGEHEWYLPWDVRYQADYAFASDNDVPLDFDELSGSRADRYLQSITSLSAGLGRTDRFGGVASLWFADDLQNPDDIDRDRVLLQRWPHVEVDGLAGGIPGIPLLRPSLDTQYTWFSALDRADSQIGVEGFRDTGIDGVSNADEIERNPNDGPDPYGDNFNAATNPGGTERDGFFQEGEPLTDSGHRAILHPRVAAPFRLGRFAEIFPEVGWHQTLYSTHIHGGDSRGLLTGRADARSRLRRRFDNDVVHVVEPFVGWAYVAPTAQSRKPLFVPETAVPQERLRSLDLDNVVLDSADRIDRAHQVTFGVTQRLFGEGEEDEPQVLRADVTLLGLYDLEEGQFGNVVVDGRVTPWWLGDLRFHLGTAPDGPKFIREGMADWSWSHRHGHRINTTYRYIRDIPDVFEDFGTGDRFDDVRDERRVDELSTNLRLALTPFWTASYRMAYSFETSRLIANKGIIEYLSKCGCWALGLEFSEDRARGVEVKALYRIVGLGKDQDPNRGGLLDW